MARVTKNTPARKPTAAKSAPVIKSNAIASEELEVAPEKTVKFSQKGEKQLIGEDIEIQSIHGLDDKAKKLAFLEEKVTVMFQEGNTADAEKYVFLSINGVGAGPNGIPWVPRGVEVTIKRKYLGVASASRQVKYKNHEQVNSEGVLESFQKAYSISPYQFTVIQDTREGLEWLRNLRATRRA